MSNKTLTAEQQEHLNNLVMRCSIFVGHHGRLLYSIGKPSTLITLIMAYEGQGLTIEFSTTSRHRNTSGKCKVMVRKKKLVLLEASGDFTNHTCRVTAKTYVPGNWEKRIRVPPRMK